MGFMQIYRREISYEKKGFIIDSVRNKKDLVNLDTGFILEHLQKFLEQNTSVLDYIVDTPLKDIPKSGKFKKLIKHIRGKARKVYGVFQTTAIAKRTALLEQYLKTSKKKDLTVLLKTHRSTRERMGYHKKLYKKIFSITGKPDSLLDIGCGINPLTFSFMGLGKDITYIAAEFSQKDIDFLNIFFRKNKMKESKAVKIDLLKDYAKLKKYTADVCFVFKVLDSLEVVKKNISYKILDAITSDFIIVSFPLKSIARKEMRLQRRNWLEKAASRLGFTIDYFSVGQELFYVLERIS